MKKLVLSFGIALIFGNAISQEIKVVNNQFKTSTGDLYSGEYKDLNADGSVNFSTLIKDGLLDGPIVYFYPNGVRKETGSFKVGLKDGLWLRYDENGVKIGQGSYANGKKDGTWLVWDPSGIKRFEMQYKEGEKVDTWYEFDSTGSLVSERTFNMASK
jgi:antitoxin component YwqK of YwqJK toxin-antitoxin module